MFVRTSKYFRVPEGAQAYAGRMAKAGGHAQREFAREHGGQAADYIRGLAVARV